MCDSSKYRVVIKPKVGKTEKNRWVYKAGKSSKKPKKLKVTIGDSSNKKTIAKGGIGLCVAPSNAGKGKKLRLLIIGDSLTAGGEYAKDIAKLLGKPGNPKWTMFGTQKKGDKVAFEGYGGWAWKSFVSKYVENSVHFTKSGTSPFIYKDKKSGKHGLDIKRYFEEKCGGKAPNVITILLGINDNFGAQHSLPNREKINKRIDERMFVYSEKLIKAIRKAAPKALIGICLTPPGNSRPEAFFANYKNAYHRWTWRQVQHLLVQAQLKKFGKREKENIFVIPTSLGIDCTQGYPDKNGVHPNPTGYKQIASSIYSWMKWQFYMKKVK